VRDATHGVKDDGSRSEIVDSPASPSPVDCKSRTPSDEDGAACDGSAIVSNGTRTDNANVVVDHVERATSSRDCTAASADTIAGYKSAFFSTFNVGVYDSFFTLVKNASKTGSEFQCNFQLF
jgi:hypothetical protein